MLLQLALPFTIFGFALLSVVLKATCCSGSALKDRLASFELEPWTVPCGALSQLLCSHDELLAHQILHG